MIEQKKKIGIVCCSNGMKCSYSEKVKELEETLLSIGLHPVFSEYIYEKSGVSSGTAKERARALMDFYRDDEVEEIFDISGGDIANGILPYLDYEIIAKSEKRFWGYSDLTTVLNAIYAKTGKTSVLYQIRNILSEYKEQQIEGVRNALSGIPEKLISNTGLSEAFLSDKHVLNEVTKNMDRADGDVSRSYEKDLFKNRYHFVQGNKMRGVVIGGNIRCFLKLAGTEYMPDFQDKILLLESRSGMVPQMETFLSQLQQLGTFDKISGILLGTFTQMEAEQCQPTIMELVQSYVGTDLPIAVTKDIGHGKDAKAIEIGSDRIFSESAFVDEE